MCISITQSSSVAHHIKIARGWQWINWILKIQELVRQTKQLFTQWTHSGKRKRGKHISRPLKLSLSCPRLKHLCLQQAHSLLITAKSPCSTSWCSTTFTIIPGERNKTKVCSADHLCAQEARRVSGKKPQTEKNTQAGHSWCLLSQNEMDFIFHMASFYSGRINDTIYSPLPFPCRGGAPIQQRAAQSAPSALYDPSAIH